MTIRRDLTRLALDGLVHRVAGGAALRGADGRSEPFDQRTTHHMAEKRAIARATLALPLVNGAASMVLDAGTTVAGAASGLPSGVLVATHSVPVLTACADRDDLELLGLGGAYQPSTKSFAGSATRAGIEALSVDVALVSAVAIGPTGLFCTNPHDAETKQLLLRAGRHVVLLVDHSKAAAAAPLRFSSWDSIDVVVIDDGVDLTALDMLRATATEIVVAPVQRGGAP